MGWLSALSSIGEAGGAKREGDLAWSRTKRQMQNRHQWEVADLRAAGLNPILSAGGAPSMGGVSQTKLPSTTKDTNQGRLIQSQIDLNKAGAAKATSDAGLSDAKKGAIQPAATVGGAVGKGLEAAGGALESLYQGFTGPQTNAAPKLRLPAQSQFMKNITRKKGESIWDFTKRKFLLWKAYRNNDMNNPNWRPNQ